jgi:uncharacterized protein
MASQIFLNLVVSNVDKSMKLYRAMGFTNNPQFSDETAKCMVWSENIFVMLMTSEKFATFTSKPIADTKITDAALALGAIEPVPFKDYGFMQQRNIEDYDGHTWEIFFMDMSKFPQQ